MNSGSSKTDKYRGVYNQFDCFAYNLLTQYLTILDDLGLVLTRKPMGSWVNTHHRYRYSQKYLGLPTQFTKSILSHCECDRWCGK